MWRSTNGSGLDERRFIRLVLVSRLLFPLAFAAALLISCGGGGAGGTGEASAPIQPSPDFSLVASPASISVQAGGSGEISLSANPANSFASQVNIQVKGLPAGVTVSPSTIVLSPGTPQIITFSAGSSAATTDATVTLAGTSGLVTHETQVTVSITSITVSSNTPPFRTRYVRTDAATPYFAWPNSGWIIYNPPTARFFATDPQSNRIFALDAKTETLAGAILVPGAFGIDDTPDHMTLYVGTQIGDVYAIDPVKMIVTKRYLASQIGPNGFSANAVEVMADGRLALLGGQGGIPNVDGYSGFAFWNPADNSISIFGTGGTPIGKVCGPMENIRGFARTPDRTQIIIDSIDSDGTLCEIDEATESAVYTQPEQPGGFIFGFAVSPDGNLIAVPYGANGYPQAAILNPHTLALLRKFPVAGDNGPGATFVFSADSQTLFNSSDSIIYAYDPNSGQQVGWMPNIFLKPIVGGAAAGPVNGPDIQATDGTGLLAGPMEEGVGFIDTAAMQPGPVGTQYLNNYLNPDTGPVGGGTQVAWNILGPISSVYFGSQEASIGSSSSETISVTAPPGAPGPADVYSLASNGGVQILPEAFSYGPAILEVTPDRAAAGGGTGLIFGYGFGPTSSNAIPAGLQVTVGGQPVAIIAYNPNAYGVEGQPFPLEAISYSIPVGAAGSQADVSVATEAGTATLHNAITYLAALQQYSLPGSSLEDGIYDPNRDVYYFTDAATVRVFSKAAGAWLAPIAIPASDNPQRLWGIALSPDGSKLAIGDAKGEAIYIVNPDNPSVVQKFPVPQTSSGVITNPAGLTISDAGMVYFTVSNFGGDGYSGYYELDTNTGAVTSLKISGPGLTTDNLLRTAISSDGSRVYFNNDGQVFSMDTTTGSISYAQDGPGCCYGDDDLTLSANQARLAATGYFYDSNLNAESYSALNDREIIGTTDLYGEMLGPDGSLLFQPTTNGIDVFDAHMGNLITRIALPVTLSQGFDALVSDGKDNILLAITGENGDGIAVIDLSSIPEPSLPQYDASIRRASSSLSEGTGMSIGIHTEEERKRKQPAKVIVPHIEP